MNFLFKILAALLLWIFIACNNRSAQSGKSADSSSKNGMVQDMELKEVAPAPSSVGYATADRKLTPPSIVKDGEVKEEEKPAELNTEDYDHIVENKFLAATQNPLGRKFRFSTCPMPILCF